MSKQILVLGMHRSGTSAIARILNLMGCYFGDESQVKKPGPENPKGFWERNDVLEVNKLILEEMGVAWDFPFDLKSNFQISKNNFDKINIIVSKLEPFRPWFIKDPRLCLLYDYWTSYLDNFINVLIVRSPFEVANDQTLGYQFDVVTGQDTEWGLGRQRGEINVCINHYLFSRARLTYQG